MPIGTPTTLNSITQGSGQATVIPSFTPTANAVIIVHFHGRDTSVPSIPTISDSASLTWTAVFVGNFNSTNRNWIGWAVAPASPAAMTVTADWGASIPNSAGQAFEITGADTTTPVVSGTTLSASGSGTTPAPGTVPAITSGNVQLLLISTRAASSSAEGGGAWTELYDTAPGGGACQIGGYYSTSGDTTPTATISSTSWRANALEIAAGGSAVDKTDSDTAALTDAMSLAPVVTASDPFTMVSAGGVESTSGIDTGALTDDTTSILITEVGPDATLAEAYVLGVAVNPTDAATLTESGAVVVGALAVTATESVTLTETSSLSSTFPGIVVDTGGEDTGTLAEAAYVAYSVGPGTDSAVLSEGASIAVGQSATPSDSDTGVLQESSEQPAVLTVVETGTVTESGSVIVTVVASETATVSDILASLLASADSADSWTLTEASIAADTTLSGAARGSVVISPRVTATADIDPLLAGSVLLTS